MKKYILALACVVSSTYSLEQDRHEQPIKFDNFFISFIDGTDFIQIQSIFEFGQRIVALLRGCSLEYGEKLATAFRLNLPEPLTQHVNANNKVGLIWFDNSYRSLKELQLYERENPEDPALAKALEHACQHFERFSEDYVVEIEAGKGVMVQIIEQWSKLRNRTDTLMLDWSKTSEIERDSLYKTMTTFEILDTFLNDLLLFLKDLVRNCPKSYHKYQEQLKQQHGSSGNN